MLCLGGFELYPRWVPRTFFMMKAKQDKMKCLF